MNIPESALATLPSSGAEQPATGITTLATLPPHSAGQPAIPIFEVAFGKGMWRAIPAEASARLYQAYMNNEDGGYTWDWGDTRHGSWKPDGEETHQSLYNRFPCMGATKHRQRSSAIGAPCLGLPREW